VSVHGEGGRVVVHLPSGERREIEAKDLGMAKKEASDEHLEQDRRGDDPDDDAGE
jgi:hypothetical protein